MGFFKITQSTINNWAAQHKTEKLLSALQDADKQVRLWAIDALGTCADLRAIEPLLQLRQQSQLRSRVEQALEHIAQDLLLVLNRLVDGMVSADQQQLLQAALTCLPAIGAPALRPLKQSLSQGQPLAAATAALALGAMRQTDAIPDLLLHLNHSHPRVLESIIKALDAFGSQAVLLALNTLVQSRHFIFDAAASAAFKTLGFEPRLPADAPPYHLAVREFHRLNQDLLFSTLEASTDPTDRLDLAQALSSRTDMDFLRNQMQKQTAQRLAVVLILGQRQDPDAMRLLWESIADPDPQVSAAAEKGLAAARTQALRCLDDLVDQHPTALPASTLLLAVRQGWHPTSAKARAGIAVAQKDWKTAIRMGQAALDPLLAAAQHFNSRNSTYELADVIAALGSIQNPEAVLSLAPYLRHADLTVRMATVDAFTQARPPQAASMLEACLGEASDELRQKIADLLNALGSTTWSSAVRGEYEDFYRLGRLGSTAAITTLITHLADDQSHPALYLKTRSHAKIRRDAALALVKLAQESPQLLRPHWKEIHPRITAPHSDSHQDTNYNRSSDCTHDDVHADQGVGLDFPASPPRGSKGHPRDF